MSRQPPLHPHVEGPASPEGKPTPPKGVEKIRAALESIHERAPAAAAGPLTGGLKPDDRLLVASFHDREVRRRFQELLLAHGIDSSWRRGGRQDQTLVDMSDRQRAAQLLDEHLAAWPDRPQARGRRMIDFMLLGAALGATIGACFIIDGSLAKNAARLGMMVLSAIACAVYGAAVGGLLGGLKDRIGRRGRLQFTILDLLLLSALVALAAFVWRLRL